MKSKLLNRLWFVRRYGLKVGKQRYACYEYGQELRRIVDEIDSTCDFIDGADGRSETVALMRGAPSEKLRVIVECVTNLSKMERHAGDEDAAAEFLASREMNLKAARMILSIAKRMRAEWPYEPADVS